ncbi:hypothetical protein F4776DRAFT_215176 [Hypoxylon sp. NC0597]|nr:hypothetical protein F4776DRAFT_215176 [Hypoxylon sp. NC0597]
MHESFNHVNAEYVLMHDHAMIQKHFSIGLANEAALKDSGAMVPFMLLLREYRRWERCRIEAPSLEQLMSQATFSKWFFARFLKICLPFPRPTDDMALVSSSFNMTVFLRLLVKMAELGYPDHWLYNIISSLGSNEITTTARAPRQYVIDPAAADKVHTSRTICVKP